nr:MAG TPA: hypothetical protein [Caudoviricetes sp.]
MVRQTYLLHFGANCRSRIIVFAPKYYFMIREAILEAFQEKGNGKISMENIEKSFLFLGLEIVLKNK